MQDNQETNPELVLARTRLRRHQATLNIEMGLSGRQNISSSGGQGATSGGTGSIGGGAVIIGEVGGTGEGGGHIYCFDGDTLASLMDGTQVPIRDVVTRSYVLAPTEEGAVIDGYVTGRVEKEFYSFLRVLFADGRITNVRPNHGYRAENGLYIPIVSADHALHWNGSGWDRVLISEKTLIKNTPRLFYNLSVRAYKAYLANGDWVSNSKILVDESLT